MSNMTKLSVLGVLMEKSMHGYEVKKHIEERMGEYTDVKFGSVYYFLSSFLENGYVREEVDDNDTEKRTYAITEEGREYFRSIAAEELHRPYEHIDPLGVLLNFIYIFPGAEVAAAFQEKIEGLRKLKEKALSERTRLMKMPEVSGLVDYIFTHTIHHVNTEIEWMEDFINYVKTDAELFID